MIAGDAVRGALRSMTRATPGLLALAGAGLIGLVGARAAADRVR